MIIEPRRAVQLTLATLAAFGLVCGVAGMVCR